MEKTEMMKRYEEENGTAVYTEYDEYLQTYVFLPTEEYMEWLEAKAEAYDRLMSGGILTRKELANIIGKPVAQNPAGSWFSFEKIPVFDHFGWCNGGKWERLPFNIEKVDIWHTSLTMPDGWEES